jgi:hypothetical protein
MSPFSNYFMRVAYMKRPERGGHVFSCDEYRKVVSLKH